MAKTTTRALTSLFLGVLVTAADAQPPALRRPAQTSEPQARRLDGVLGIIGDKVVLESSIAVELQAQIDGAENAGRRVTQEMKGLWRYQILQRRLDSEALAQGARTMRDVTRDQVDRIVDQKVQEFVRQEEEKAGSVNQLTQELGFLGQTLESIEEDRRTRLMGEIAHQQYIARRYQDSWALAVTPSEMRRFYQENRSQFVSDSSTDLEIVAIPGGADAEAAMAHARAAAKSWREPRRSATEVAEEFTGVALDPRQRVRNTEDDPHATPIKEFAGSAKQGDVSEPIQRGNSFWILRATWVHAARSGLFEDPKIQSLIQRQLALTLIEQDRLNLIDSQRQKIRYVTPVPRSR